MTAFGRLNDLWFIAHGVKVARTAMSPIRRPLDGGLTASGLTAATTQCRLLLRYEEPPGTGYWFTQLGVLHDAFGRPEQKQGRSVD